LYITRSARGAQTSAEISAAIFQRYQANSIRSQTAHYRRLSGVANRTYRERLLAISVLIVLNYGY